MKHRRHLTAVDLAARIDTISSDDTEALLGGAVVLSDVSMTPDLRARLAFETARGAPYTDEEWRTASQSLTAFMIIAADWKRERDAAAG